jgi:hypothetical protein
MLAQIWKKKFGNGGLDPDFDSLIDYIKYEHPNRADHVKKILEQNITSGFLKTLTNSRDEKPKSLDIGCATCRYPLLLSQNGFLARGYDINDEAIRICESIAKDYQDVEVFKRNILTMESEPDEYTVITSMMGTFNLIPVNEHGRFFKWIYESLQVGGMFIFTMWNSECPYTSYLHFYNREEVEGLRSNARPFMNTLDLLKDTGFLLRDSEFFCFLPDICYESWMGQLKEEEIIGIDQDLSKKLDHRNSQMSIICAIKP